jgi:hypothetical protein
MLSYSLTGFGVMPIPGIGPTTAPSLISAGKYEPPVPGECTADGKLIWRGATPTAPAHWERLAAGEQCSTIGTGSVKTGVPWDPLIGPCYSRDTVVTQMAPNGMPVSVVVPGGQIIPCPPSINENCGKPGMPPCPTPDIKPGKTLKVGPFLIPYQARAFAIHWTGPLPKDWQDFIVAELSHDCSGCVSSSMRDSGPGHPLGVLRDFLPGLPMKINQDFAAGPAFGSASHSDNVYGDVADLNPIAFVQHPDTGEDFGIYMWVDARNPRLPVTSPSGTNPYVLSLIWRKVDRHWYTDAWNWIKHIVAEIVDLTQAVLCSIVGSPGMTKSAISTGNPYVVGGEIVAQSLAPGICPQGPNCQDPANALVAACKRPSLLPPWYKTWWGVSAIVLAGLGVGAAVYQRSRA